MAEVHELHEEKLLMSQMKNKTKFERKSSKRGSKRGDSPAEDTEKKLCALQLEQQVEVRNLLNYCSLTRQRELSGVSVSAGGVEEGASS